MQDFWHWLVGEKGQIAMAGALGGVVRWLTLREDWRSGFVSITVGAILALYAGPLAAPVVDAVLGRIILEPAARASLSGFLIGVGGIAVSGLILDLWQARRREAVAAKKEGTKP